MTTSTYTSITNDDDIIDTRELIEAIETLESDIEDREGEVAAAGMDVERESEPGSELAEMRDELNTLRAFAAEADWFEDYRHGVALIRDSYFETYAQELADDLGMLNNESHNWPYTCIDWAQAARELQMDYTAVTFDGVTYWGR